MQKKRRNGALWLLAAILAGGFGPQFLKGQATITSAQLRGTVTDSSGALVPGATITATDNATGVQQTIVASDGLYVFKDLRPSTYSVIAAAPGFKKVKATGIVLHVGQQGDFNIHFEVGEVSTQVTVEGAAPVLDTANAAVATTVDTKMTLDLPLLDRQVTNLALLAPGVTYTNGGNGYAMAGTGGIGISNINFTSNGQRNSTAEARLDGALATVPETGGGVNLMPYTPSPEIVQEFRIQTSSFSAEYGSNGGTVLNIVTKSGSNNLHGAGYYFGRRPQMDANSFYANEAGTPKADYKRDDFGGVVNGPIKKNKLFYLFAYDRVLFDSPNTLRTTVPTALQKTGDFSQSFNSDGSLRAIYNPQASYQDASGNWVRPQFPGNKIPQNILDPVALKLMALYPAPNTAGDPITGFNNFVKAGADAIRISTYDFKLDWYASDRNRVSGRYSYHPYESQQARFFNNPADSSVVNDLIVHYAVVDDTFTLNASTVWVNRATYNRRSQISHNAVTADPTTFGFPKSLIEANGLAAMPLISVGNYAGMNSTCCIDTRDGSQLYDFSSTVSHTMGRHEMRFGGEIQWWLENYWQPGIPNGVFSFDAGHTAQSVFGPDPTQGDALASMLTGFAGWSQINFLPGTSTLSHSQDFFFQDDWRVTNKLTVNLGVRYEWTSPFTERYNRTGIADYTANTGVNVPGLGDLKGESLSFNAKNRTKSPDRNNLGPRVGVAYRLDEKTVIRAGAGLYYGILSPGQNNWYTAPQYRGYSIAQFSLDGGITQNATLSNPWPNGLTYPQGNKYGPLAMWGFDVNNDNSFGSDPLRQGEIYLWNFGVQRQLGKSIVEISYVGNRATHLPLGAFTDRNVLPEAVKAQYSLEQLNELVPNPFYSLFVGPQAMFDEPTSIYSNPTIPRQNLLRPYPQFGRFGGNNPNWGTSRYDSLQIRFERRFEKGFSLLTNYTWSKTMDNSSEGLAGWMAAQTGFQNPNNLLQGEWSVASSDVPQHFLLAATYELPFGRGKRIGGNWGPIVNGFVGGWQVNGIYNLQSGFPLHVVMASGRLSDGSQRPNVSGNARSSYSIKDVVDFKGSFFNTAAYSDPGEQHYGDAPRYDASLRQQGVNNLDFALFKNFRFGEKYNLQLRGEAFNALNRTQFGTPDTNFGGSTFGQITSTYNQPRRVQLGARFEF